MNKLVEEIKKIRGNLDNWKPLLHNETQTRTTVINPLLGALGWDVRDPREVKLEYTTCDGKFVDYALIMNQKPVLIIEAKKLTDPLSDTKVITQTVSYANNEGLTYCVLTNGVKWCVYRSNANCAAPDKLFYEVNIEDCSLTAEQVAEQLWLLSCEGMRKKLPDQVYEEKHFDPKIRHALSELLKNPKTDIVRRITEKLDDLHVSPDRIKRSLRKIGEQLNCEAVAAKTEPPVDEEIVPVSSGNQGTDSEYDEEFHINGKGENGVILHRALDQYCMSLSDSVLRTYNKSCIKYDFDGGKCFCSYQILKNSLRVFVMSPMPDAVRALSFARDVSQIGHWGNGKTEFKISNLQQFEQIKRYIRQDFESLKRS